MDVGKAISFVGCIRTNMQFTPILNTSPYYGQLGRKEEALENWRKLLAEDRGWTAESFEAWYHLWNMRDEDIAKLMDGVAKSGVLEAEAKPGPVTPVQATPCSARSPTSPGCFPVLPLIGGGHTRLQPVFVEDVAEAVASILTDTRTRDRINTLANCDAVSTG